MSAREGGHVKMATSEGRIQFFDFKILHGGVKLERNLLCKQETGGNRYFERTRIENFEQT